MKLLFYLLLFQAGASFSFSLTTATIRQQTRSRIQRRPLRQAVRIDGYDEAFRIIDECAVKGEPSNYLYDAVHFIEKNAYIIYPNLSHKQALWDKAHGSWKLQLSTGGAKFRSFHQPPSFLPFSFAMIAEKHFGNGIGLNEKTMWLSLLHNHCFNARIRQMVVTVADVYLGGFKVTRFVPGFIRKAINLGKKPGDFHDKRPPAFVIIGASDKALIARGNQSGGLAYSHSVRL